MARGATEHESSEYVELIKKLEVAQESDVVEQALAAAHEHLQGSEELRFVQILAGIVAARLERARGDLARLTEKFRRQPSPEPTVPSE